MTGERGVNLPTNERTQQVSNFNVVPLAIVKAIRHGKDSLFKVAPGMDDDLSTKLHEGSANVQYAAAHPNQALPRTETPFPIAVSPTAHRNQESRNLAVLPSSPFVWMLQPGGGQSCYRTNKDQRMTAIPVSSPPLNQCLDFPVAGLCCKTSQWDSLGV